MWHNYTSNLKMNQAFGALTAKGGRGMESCRVPPFQSCCQKGSGGRIIRLVTAFEIPFTAAIVHTLKLEAQVTESPQNGGDLTSAFNFFA